jgi:hypothetical protein
LIFVVHVHPRTTITTYNPTTATITTHLHPRPTCTVHLPRYLRKLGSRIDISKDTPLGAVKAPAHHLLDSLPPSHGDTRGAAAIALSPPIGGGKKGDDATVGSAAPAEPSFVTESFFLTLRSLHVGLICTIKWMENHFQSSRSYYNQLLQAQAKMKKREASMSPIDKLRFEKLNADVSVGGCDCRDGRDWWSWSWC